MPQGAARSAAAAMARAIVTSNPEPLYDKLADATLEVFHLDQAVANSFGAHSAGWFHWTCAQGCLPGPITGPFGSSYSAFQHALEGGSERKVVFGRRANLSSAAQNRKP